MPSAAIVGNTVNAAIAAITMPITATTPMPRRPPLSATKNAAKPKDVNINVYSTPIRLRVASTPVTLGLPSGDVSLKKGEKTELTVSLERKYGFEEAVEILFEPAKGVAGVGAKSVKIEKGQTEAKLEITANENPTIGQHDCRIKAKMKFNNVNVEESSKVKLNVTE